MVDRRSCDEWTLCIVNNMIELIEELEEACKYSGDCENECEREDNYTCPFQVYTDHCMIKKMNIKLIEAQEKIKKNMNDTNYNDVHPIEK